MTEEWERLFRGEHSDPFRLLGMHPGKRGGVCVRALLPWATRAWVVDQRHGDKCHPMDRSPNCLPFGFPVGIDVFVYTREEFDRLRETLPEWYTAITSGVEVE